MQESEQVAGAAPDVPGDTIHDADHAENAPAEPASSNSVAATPVGVTESEHAPADDSGAESGERAGAVHHDVGEGEADDVTAEDAGGDEPVTENGAPGLEDGGDEAGVPTAEVEVAALVQDGAPDSDHLESEPSLGGQEGAEVPASSSPVDDAGAEVSALEGDLITAGTRAQFDALFSRARNLGQRVQEDGRMGPHERSAIEQHIRDILKRARIEFDLKRARADEELGTCVERATLALEQLAGAESIVTVQEVRADLRPLRDIIRNVGDWASRDARTRAWELWQKANQTAWTALNDRWQENERALGAILDRAGAEMERGNPRAAKTLIKSFHEEAKSSVSSHESMKRLRDRARALWDQSTVAARERHEAYVAIANKRLGHLRELLSRTQQERRRVESNLAALEVDLRQAQTDVAAALLQGRIAERRKELRRLESETVALEARISEAEKVVS